MQMNLRVAPPTYWAILIIKSLIFIANGEEEEEITRIRLFKDPKESVAIPIIKARDSPTIVMANGAGKPIAVAQSQSTADLSEFDGLNPAAVGNAAQFHLGCRPCTIKCPEPIPTIPCPPLPPPPPPPMPSKFCLPPPRFEFFPPRLPILPPHSPPKKPMFLPPPPPLVCPPPQLCPPPQPCPPAPVCPRPAPCHPPPPTPPTPSHRQILQIPLPREEIAMPPPPQIRCLPAPIPALSLPPLPSPNLFLRPSQTVILQNDCCCNCERLCRASGKLFLATTRNRLAFGARIRPAAWPFGILSAENLALESGLEEAKCNSRILQRAILENISTDLEVSKRRIQWAAEKAMGGTPVNVICGVTEFTFVVHAAFYCQAGAAKGSCYAFTTTIDGNGGATNLVAE